MLINKTKKSNYREIKKTMKKKWSEYRLKYDTDGRVIVNMTVKNDSDFLSVYSEYDTPIISTEVADFIENSTFSLRPKQPLALHIHSNCIDDREKEDYRLAIQEYYAEKYIASKNEMRFNLIAFFLLMFAGVTTLVCAFLVDNHIWAEVVDIAAWVFLWEAVDIGVFKNRESNMKRRRYLSYMSMKVEYKPLLVKDHEYLSHD